MSGTIHLGYVVGTGEPVEIPLRHTAVTGQTQESGKTTTLEGLISRSGLQAVAYVTKRGESSFHVMHPIPPYFQERADWQFVQSLLEASTKSTLKFEQSWIMRASEGARTLGDVRANIQRYLHGVRDTRVVKQKRGAEPKERWLQKPARGLSGDIYYILDKYLDVIMPQLANMPYTSTLELAAGLNVMDLRDYEFPLQALVIRSVTDYIREKLEGTINIIPEAWEFAPKFRGSPVRLAAEEFVRKAAAMKNFLWIDSQDLAGVADVLMRQVGVWLFGVQRATREIVRALEHMPEGLPARRPRPADIATLSKGQFYVCFGREMHKVYVQPAWMTAAHAEAIARGEEDVDSARDILKEYAGEHKPAVPKSSPREMRRDHEPLRSDVDDGRDRQPAQPEAARTSPSARDARQLAEDGDSEEAMWKEKYEALCLELTDALGGKPGDNLFIAEAVRQLVVAASGRVPDPEHSHGTNGNMDFIYRHVRDRLSADLRSGKLDGALVQLLGQQPEIQVKRERRVLAMNDTETPGRIAVLIAEKFFDAPQNSSQVTKEFKRRGWFSVKTSNAAVLRPLADIAEMGFLTRDGSNYQAVPGMKINIVEERA